MQPCNRGRLQDLREIQAGTQVEKKLSRYARIRIERGKHGDRATVFAKLASAS